jgi:Ras-related protein Rab-11A
MLTASLLEIYRIVSSKALDSGESGQNQPGARQPVIDFTPQDSEQKQGCC